MNCIRQSSELFTICAICNISIRLLVYQKVVYFNVTQKP